MSPVCTNTPQTEDNLGVMGVSRSTTSSPVPPSMQSTAWMSCRRMIYIKNNPPSGHWPVPESFWPDPSLQTLVNKLIFFPAILPAYRQLFVVCSYFLVDYWTSVRGKQGNRSFLLRLQTVW